MCLAIVDMLGWFEWQVVKWTTCFILEVFITKYTIWLLTSAVIKIMIILFHYDRGRGRGVICQ